MKDCGSRERIERRAPASSIDLELARVLVSVCDDGMRAFCCRSASLAFCRSDESGELLDRRDCCRCERMVSREGVPLGPVAEGMDVDDALETGRNGRMDDQCLSVAGTTTR